VTIAFKDEMQGDYLQFISPEKMILERGVAIYEEF